jgi:hypothetical protein
MNTMPLENGRIDGYRIFIHNPPSGRADGPLWYGDLQIPYAGEITDSPESNLYIMPDLLSGSDYSGGAVERSNHRAFINAFGHLPGIHAVYGGHGTYAIAVSVRMYRLSMVASPYSGLSILRTLAEMYEALSALQGDDPVIDDEALREVERELQDEAWDHCVRKDYLTALEGRLEDLAAENDIDAAIEWRSIDDGEIRRVFEIAAADAGVYWEKDGADYWIDAEKAAAATDFPVISDWIDWLYTDAD